MKLEGSYPLQISNRIIFYDGIVLFVLRAEKDSCEVGVNVKIEPPALEHDYHGHLESRITIRPTDGSTGLLFDLADRKTHDYRFQDHTYRITLKALEYVQAFVSYYPDFDVEVI